MALTDNVWPSIVSAHCRQVLVLYELLQGKADQFIAWSGRKDSPAADSRIDAPAALQSLIADQEWAEANRYQI